MKVQIQEQVLRFRIDETELAALLEGMEAVNRTVLPGGGTFVQTLALVELNEAALECAPGHWCLLLPRTVVETYVASLPNRQGLEFQIGEVQLVFEVDVRDSARKRLGGV